MHAPRPLVRAIAPATAFLLLAAGTVLLDATTSADERDTPFDPASVGPADRRTGVDARTAAGEEVVAPLVSVNAENECDLPRDIALHPDGSRAYVANEWTDNLAVIDVVTGDTLDVIDVGGGPIDLALTPDGATLLVLNSIDRSITFLDTTDDSVVETIDVVPPVFDESLALQIRVNPAGTRAIVSWGKPTKSFSSDDGFTVVSLPERGIERAFEVFGVNFWDGDAPKLADRTGEPLEVVPFWIAADDVILVPDSLTIRRFDAGDGNTLPELPFGVREGFDVAPNGSFALLSEFDGSGYVVQRIDLATGAITDTFPVPTELSGSRIPLRILDDSTALVGTRTGVCRIDLAGGAVNCLTLGSIVETLAVSPDASLAIATSFGRAFLLDLAAGSLLGEVETPEGGPSVVTHTPAGERALLLTDPIDDRFRVIGFDGADLAVLRDDAVGGGLQADAPRDAALSPDGERFAIVHPAGRSVTIHDLPDGTELQRFAIDGVSPRQIAWDADGTHLVVLDDDANALFVHRASNGNELARIDIDGPVDRMLVTETPGGSMRAYVAGGTFFSSDPDYLHIVRIDGAASTLLHSIEVGAWDFDDYDEDDAQAIAISPDGTLLALACGRDDAVELRDATDGALVASVPVSDTSGTDAVAFSPDGAFVYATKPFSEDVVEIMVAGAASAITRTFEELESDVGLRFDETGAFLIAASAEFAVDLAVVRLSDGAVVSTLETDGFRQRLDRLDTPLGERWVLRDTRGGATVLRQQGGVLEVVRTFTMPEEALDLVYAPLTGRIAFIGPGADAFALVRLLAIADLNGDGSVDGADLGILLGSWGAKGGIGDINGDGIVNGQDLGILLGSWG